MIAPAYVLGANQVDVGFGRYLRFFGFHHLFLLRNEMLSLSMRRGFVRGLRGSLLRRLSISKFGIA